MASFNRVILMGNLTRDPEVRIMPNGTSVCRFSVAVGRSYRGQDGEQHDETTFIEVDSFGKQADLIGKYMQKGRPILLEGRLRLDQWESQTGEKRSKLVVVMESFQFVGSRSDSSNDYGSNDNQSSSQFVENLSSSKQNDVANDYSELDEDVPF